MTLQVVYDLLDGVTCASHNHHTALGIWGAVTTQLLVVGIAVFGGITCYMTHRQLEFTEGMLDFLEQSSITPGSKGTVTAMSPDGTATVEIGGAAVGVGGFASARILVTAG